MPFLIYTLTDDTHRPSAPQFSPSYCLAIISQSPFSARNESGIELFHAIPRGFQKRIQAADAHAGHARDFHLSDTLIHQSQDLLFLAVPDVFFVHAACRPPKLYPVGFTLGQCFFRALTDHVAFQFGDQPERECQNLALHIVAQFITVLDGQDFRARFHTMFQYRNDHKQFAPQTGQFGTHDHVARFDPFQQLSQFAFFGRARSRNAVVNNPPVDRQPAFARQILHADFLIFAILFVRGHP